MADSPSYLNANRARTRPNRGSLAGIPHWVKVFVIVFIVLLLLFVILHLTGNGLGDYMHMTALEHMVGQ